MRPYRWHLRAAAAALLTLLVLGLVGCTQPIDLLLETEKGTLDVQSGPEGGTVIDIDATPDAPPEDPELQTWIQRLQFQQHLVAALGVGSGMLPTPEATAGLPPAPMVFVLDDVLSVSLGGEDSCSYFEGGDVLCADEAGWCWAFIELNWPAGVYVERPCPVGGLITNVLIEVDLYNNTMTIYHWPIPPT